MSVNTLSRLRERLAEEVRDSGCLSWGLVDRRLECTNDGTVRIENVPIQVKHYRVLAMDKHIDIEYPTSQYPIGVRGHKLVLRVDPRWLDAVDERPKTTRADAGSNTMSVEPLFGVPRDPATPCDVFVLMPFNEDMRPVYELHIKAVVKKLNLVAARADDFYTARAFVLDIWDAICDAKLVIGDCTGRSPNVFYEIGLCHAVGKTVVLIAQDDGDVPADLRHIRYIKYTRGKQGMCEFEDSLSKTIAKELGIS